MTEAEIETTCSRSEGKLRALRERIASCGSALVAFSGGVDSAFLLKVAHDVLGERCAALLALSASIPEREREEARSLARELGTKLVVKESRELDNPDYAKNATDRCYHCKSELFGLTEAVRVELGLAAVFDGFNADDRRDFRPGHRAAQEKGVRSPLAEAGLTKEEIRAWSKRLGLPTWDKPQMACLASRLPYGTGVTVERLMQVGGAEQALWDLGFRQFRVRHHGEVARLEVAAEEYERLLDPALRQQASQAIKRYGFKFVALDLEPFRSGRMNEAAPAARSSAPDESA
jgi:uncharacterized protein